MHLNWPFFTYSLLPARCKFLRFLSLLPLACSLNTMSLNIFCYRTKNLIHWWFDEIFFQRISASIKRKFWNVLEGSSKVNVLLLFKKTWTLKVSHCIYSVVIFLQFFKFEICPAVCFSKKESKTSTHTLLPRTDL